VRALSADLLDIQENKFRQREWKLYVYDYGATRGTDSADTLSRIVQGADLDPLTGPLDLTDYVTKIQMSERSSDFAQGSLLANSITFEVSDRGLVWDPVGGSQSRWLKPGNFVRIREGEAGSTLYENESFSGSAIGVAGTYAVIGGDIVAAEDVEIREGSIGGTLLELGTHYTVDEVAGTITGVGTKWVAATTYYVTYRAHNIPVSEWPWTFTGTIVGRAGNAGRDRNNNAILQLAAEDRMASLLKITTTSQAFDQGTQYSFMMRSILQDDLGFADTEFELGALGGQLTTQATTQMVDESPMISLAKIAFVDGFVPYFDGEGILRFYENVSSKSVDILYDTFDLFEQFTRPYSPLEDVNEVEVIGLESTLTKISQPKQALATATITLGFFGGDASIPVAWSDDKTAQADNVYLNAISSVTGALLPFGAEELNITPDDDGGYRFGRIEVEGAFYAPLVTVLYAARIAASYIPDNVAAFGGGATIPVGRIIEGTASIAIGLVLATIGRGDYEILGEPYEYVFKEIRGVARVGDFAFIDIRNVTIENHLLDTQQEVDDIAVRELRTQRKRANVWNCVMRHDLRLVPGDKFYLPDNREFIVTEIQRSISRVEPQLATLAIYETTAGVNP